MRTFQQIGTDAGALVTRKNAAYGSSFATAGKAMQLLYPDGVSAQQLADALVLVRIWDKLMRIATDRDALGENPYNDIIGYGILGVAMHQTEEHDATWPGDAKTSNAIAASPVKVKDDSAQPPVRPESPQTKSETDEETNSTSPIASYESTAESVLISRDCAPVPSAIKAANAKEAGHRKGSVLNFLAWFIVCGQCIGFWIAYMLRHPMVVGSLVAYGLTMTATAWLAGSILVGRPMQLRDDFFDQEAE